METINQFKIFLAERSVIKMPIGAQLLSVDNKEDGLQLSAIVNNAAKTEDRVFELVGSDSALPTLPSSLRRRHVGSAQLAGITWHLFEIV